MATGSIGRWIPTASTLRTPRPTGPSEIDPLTGLPVGWAGPSTNVIDPNDLTPRFSIQEMGGAMPGVMPGAPIIPGMPGLPAYPGIVGVNELFSPTFGRNETITRGAENAVGGGFAGSGFGGAQTNRLLDSERKENFLLGHQILEPYLNREFEKSEGAANRQSRLNEIAAEGAQALQRLQLSEAGQGQRLTAELEARLRQQVLEGEQAIQRLTLQEAGETSRQRTGIGGTLANTLLQGVLSGKGVGNGESTRAPFNVGATFGTPSNLNMFNAPVAYNPTARGEGGSGGVNSLLGGSNIDLLLKKYGLLP